jgi:hypothetical protein
MAKTTAFDLAFAIEKSNATVMDVATRIGGESSNILDEIMNSKSVKEQNEYKKYKAIILEINELGKQILEGEKDTTDQGKEKVENLKLQVREKEKLAEKSRPKIQISEEKKANMLGSTTKELDAMQSVINKKSMNIKLNEKEIELNDTMMTKGFDQAAMQEKLAKARQEVETKRDVNAKMAIASATIQQQTEKGYIELEQDRASALSDLAKAQNLGVHAGYEALNQQITTSKKYIDNLNIELKIQQDLQREVMKTAGMEEGKDYDINSSKGAIELAFTKKRLALETAHDEAGKVKLEQQRSQALSNAEVIYKQGTELVKKQTEITTLTKEIMEGYLAANKEFIANAGVFSGIIGSTKKAVGQILGTGAAAGKWSGVYADKSLNSGQRAPGYTTSGTFSSPGANVTEREVARRGLQTPSGPQYYQQLPLEQTEAYKSEMARSGTDSQTIHPVLQTPRTKTVGGGPRYVSRGPVMENLVAMLSSDQVQAMLPRTSGGPTPSGYVISKQKTDQYKDLISMLNPAMVHGGIPGKDSVPVPGVGLLMPGEAIVTGDEESALAEMINKGQIKGMAGGGEMGGARLGGLKTGNISRNMGSIKSLGGAGLVDSSSRYKMMGLNIGSVPNTGPKAGSDEWKVNFGKQKTEQAKLIGANLHKTTAIAKTNAADTWAGKKYMMKHWQENEEMAQRIENRKYLVPGENNWAKGATGGRFGNNNGIQIRHLSSGGDIQVPRGIARQFASSPSPSSSGEMTLKLNPEVRDLLVVDGRKNYNSGTRI